MFLLIGLQAFWVLTGVVQGQECLRPCVASTTVYKYAENFKYEYAYRSAVQIKHSSGMIYETVYKGDVFLTKLKGCQQDYKFSVFTVTSPQPLKLIDMRNPVRVNFNDGAIDSNICVSPKDSVDIINMKRGIISMFQARINSNSETDVYGTCPTKVVVTNTPFTITKTRNLAQCSQWKKSRQYFSDQVYNMFSDGEYTLTHTLVLGVPTTITLMEQYSQVPIFIDQRKITITVTSTLDLKKFSLQFTFPDTFVSKSIVFDDVIPQAPTSTTIVNAIKYGARLAELLQEADAIEISAAYNKLTNDDDRKRFIITLFSFGNDGINMALSLNLDKTALNLIHNLFFFTEDVSVERLQILLNMLINFTVDAKSYFGISKLFQQYVNSTTCKDDTLLRIFSDKIVTLLEGPDPNTAMKLLENLGTLSATGVSKLIAIAQDQTLPIQTRLYALKLYQLNQCNLRFHDSAITLLANATNTQIGIEAYTALINCPTKEGITTILSVVNSSTDTALKNYINTHLALLKSGEGNEILKYYLEQNGYNPAPGSVSSVNVKRGTTSATIYGTKYVLFDVEVDQSEVSLSKDGVLAGYGMLPVVADSPSNRYTFLVVTTSFITSVGVKILVNDIAEQSYAFKTPRGLDTGVHLESSASIVNSNGIADKRNFVTRSEFLPDGTFSLVSQQYSGNVY